MITPVLWAEATGAIKNTGVYEMDDNTRWANIPVVSLHVDLVETDLEDFAEHFENRLRQAIDQVELLGAYLDDPLMGDLEGYIPLWNKDPEDDESPAPGITWEDLGPGKYIRITSTRSSATRIAFMVDEWTGDSPPQVHFIVFATRYRRDRLKIVVFEWPRLTGAEKDRYARPIKDWLKGGWGDDGMIERNPEDAPPADAVPALGRPGRRRDPWNRKAIDRLLAGDDPYQVRKDWRAEYEADIKMSLDQTSDGEAKTWQRRVWKPYSEAKGAK